MGEGGRGGDTRLGLFTIVNKEIAKNQHRPQMEKRETSKTPMCLLFVRKQQKEYKLSKISSPHVNNPIIPPWLIGQIRLDRRIWRAFLQVNLKVGKRGNNQPAQKLLPFHQSS